MVQSTAQVLEERGTRYGVFMGQARIAQSLHLVLRQGMETVGKNTFDFAPDELEAMHMIVNKIARIYNGDNHYSDSWRDIAGYATLVADRLDKDQEEVKRFMESQNEQNTRAEDVTASPGSDGALPTWEQDVELQRAGEESGSDSRPDGQSPVRRLPVRIEVQDGIHNSTSETQPGIPVHTGRECNC